MDKTDLTSADLVWDVCPLCPVFVGKLSAGDAAGVILIAVGKMRFFVVDPQDPLMEPYYVIMRLPEGDKEEFILILPFTPANKDNMIAWMAARGICTDV